MAKIRLSRQVFDLQKSADYKVSSVMEFNIEAVFIWECLLLQLNFQNKLKQLFRTTDDKLHTWSMHVTAISEMRHVEQSRFAAKWHMNLRWANTLGH